MHYDWNNKGKQHYYIWQEDDLVGKKSCTLSFQRLSGMEKTGTSAALQNKGHHKEEQK